MRIKRCAAAAVSTVLSVTLAPAANAATDAPSPRDIIATAPQVVDAEHPLAPIGPKLPASSIAPTTKTPKVATQTEHGEDIALRTKVRYDVSMERPEARSLTGAGAVTPGSCAADLSAGEDKVLNHFEFCSVDTNGYNVLDGRTGEVIGHVSWRRTTAGNTYANDRAAYFTTRLDRIMRTGTTTDGLLKINWSASGYSGSDGSNPPCEVTANASNPTLLSQWQAGLAAKHVIVGERATGYGRDFVSRCGVAGYEQNSGGNGRFLTTGIRADSASYLNGTGGGIFDQIMPVLNYSRSSTAHGQVAEHINTAQTNPADTFPEQVGKSVPGSIASGRTLSRLYEDWDSVASAQRQKNESAKNKACAVIRPEPSDGLDCDEYPFGSTWEGAGVGDNNFSVKYLSATQNRSAGGTLASWYASDRILHKDRFYVRILP